MAELTTSQSTTPVQRLHNSRVSSACWASPASHGWRGWSQVTNDSMHLLYNEDMTCTVRNLSIVWLYTCVIMHIYLGSFIISFYIYINMCNTKYLYLYIYIYEHLSSPFFHTCCKTRGHAFPFQVQTNLDMLLTCNFCCFQNRHTILVDQAKKSAYPQNYRYIDHGS